MAALFINHLALFIHHIVIFDQLLPDIEVVRFDLLLSTFDRPGDHPVLDGNSLLHPKFLHEA
jgi:hypothetical protein